jgi:hypothetical protein
MSLLLRVTFIGIDKQHYRINYDCKKFYDTGSLSTCSIKLFMLVINAASM